MRGRAVRILPLLVLVGATSLAAQTPKHPRLGRETWYDAMLKKTNASHTDYGEWLEERRQALLDASVRNPFFWFSFWSVAVILLLSFVVAKLLINRSESNWEHAGVEADLRNQERYWRQKANEAVEQYNKHIEECNRAAEAAEAGRGRPGWGSSTLENVRAELQRVASQLEAVTQERNKLQEELRQKSVIVSDLSLRLDVLSKKVNGAGRPSGMEDSLSPNGKENGAVVDHINRLQEELYTERQKNKRLKGS